MIRHFLKDKKGNVAVTAALLSVPIMAAVGASIDYSRILSERNRLQLVSDAAALAGAGAEDRAEIRTATEYFTAGDEYNITPQVEFENNIVTVSADYDLPLMFLGVLSESFAEISVSSSATKSGIQNTCIYALDDMQRDALSIVNSGTFNSSCNVQVNSDDAQALSIDNSGTVIAPSFSVNGNYDVTSSGTVNANLQNNQPKLPDPLRNIPVPMEAGDPCDYNNHSVATASSETLIPGVYCGGLSITAAGSVTMQPGTYVLRGGPLSIDLSGSLTGNGVLVYFEDNQSYLSLANSGTVSLTSKDSGPHKGVVFFQGRNSTSPVSAYQVALSGKITVGGAIYVPNASLSLAASGTAATPHQTPVIANTIQAALSGTARFGLDPNLNIPIADALSPRSSTVRLIN